MDFQQLETQFWALDGQFRTGQITYEMYSAAVAQLQLMDANGAIWQIQEQTGAWFVFLQGQWEPMDPPRPTTPGMGVPIDLSQQVVPPAPDQATVIAQRPNGVMPPQLSIQPPKFSSEPPLFSTTPPMMVPPPMMGNLPPGTGNVGMNRSQKASHRNKSPWRMIGLIGGSVIVLALLVVGIVSLVKPGSNTNSYRIQEQETLTLLPGQTTIQDDNGTSLAVAAEALPAEDTVTQLKIYAASGDLEKQLRKNYTLETPFYEVTLEGQNDGNGPASLSLPAPNPNSRLLMIIDMQSAIILASEPQNGVLMVDVHLGPTDLSVLYPDGDATQTHSVLYAVITPLKETGALPRTNDLANDESLLGESNIQMVSHRISQEQYGKSCSPISLKAVTIFQRCQSNEDGTVMVIYPLSDKMTHIDAYNVAKEIEAAMSTYAGKGYTNASLSASSPLLAVVSDSYTSPEYNFKNGVIYLPSDIPVKISTEKTGIWHETGHWIQNRIYSMAIAKAVGARSWWIDVSAELMVMEVMPEYLSDNLSTYGKITKDDGVTLAFQSAPYQWPADFYVHAQLVKVNMCDLGCPLTVEDFHYAINNGRYPFNGNYEQEKVTANLEDYARYLLGVAPQLANSGISLAGVQNQDEYGQIVSVMRSNNTLVKFNHNGSEPQIKEETTQTGMNLIINAPLEKDGVYPLQVTSGSEGKYTGLPLMLVVEPGVPFIYRLDGGEVMISDGGKEVKIGPIHAGLGVGTIRLVAYSKTGSQSFKAKIEAVNLDGTWVLGVGDLLSNNIACTGSNNSESAGPDEFAQIGSAYFGFLGAMGEMITDSSGQTLEWSQVEGRMPAEMASGDFTFEALAITETDGIRLQGKLGFPEPADGTGYLPGIRPGVAKILPMGAKTPTKTPLSNAGLAVVVLLPAVGMSLIPLSKKRQRLGIALAFGMMALSIAGCFGFSMYGTIEGDIKITKLEYVGGTGPSTWLLGSPVSGNPIWVFKKGTATYPINLTVKVVSEDFEGNETTEVNVCSGTATYSVVGGIYEELTVVLPDNSE